MAELASGVDYSERFDLPQVLAELAAKEWEALEVIKTDVCQWLSETLQLHITPTTFLDTLGTGVQLCKLVDVIQQAARDACKRGATFNFKVPLEPVNCNPKAGEGSFFARDNASNFLSWCRSLGVEEAVIFESEGLVLHKDEKRVILCLLDVARFAEKVGIPPPQLVKMENEIDMLERLDDERSCDDGIPGTSEAMMTMTIKLDDQPGTLDVEMKTSESEVESPMNTSPTPTLSPKPLPSDKARKSFVSKLPVRRSSRRLVDKSQKFHPMRTSVFKPHKRVRDDEGEGPAAPSRKRVRTGSRGHGGTQRGVTPTGNTAGGAKEEEKPKESVDENVMRRMAECTCRNKIEVTNCGRGKFIVKGASGRKMTIYARLLSDRLMVRVGGGWDTLDHFLLKQDPCRVHALHSSAAVVAGDLHSSAALAAGDL